MPVRPGTARLGKSVAALLLLGVAGAVGWLIFFADASETPARRDRPPVPVVVAKATEGNVVERIEAIGTAQANESVTITAKITDVVEGIHFIEGQKVDREQLLVQLRDAEQRAQLSKAEAELLAAEQQHERVSRLARTGTATSAQMEQATARLQSLRAEIEGIRARIADRAIRAPFEGVVGIRRVSPGTLIQPGTEITTLDDLSIIKIDFSIPETFAAVLAPGQEIAARVAAHDDRSFAGEVAVVSPRVNPATRAITVRAHVPNEDGALRPGMLVTLDVIRSRRTALLVPEGAIVPVGDQTFVFVVSEDEHARRTEVETGHRSAGRVEVVAGLRSGDRVVVEGTVRVSDGGTVRVIRELRPPEEG